MLRVFPTLFSRNDCSPLVVAVSFIFIQTPNLEGGWGAGSSENKANLAQLGLELGLSLAIMQECNKGHVICIQLKKHDKGEIFWPHFHSYLISMHFLNIVVLKYKLLMSENSQIIEFI